MKLSISNIAWDAKHDDEMYIFLKNAGFDAVEIAPTRIFPKNPYDNLQAVKAWAKKLKNDYGLSVSSIQSIWYGKSENIFGTLKDKRELIAYTKKAVLFAETIGCENLVFGCPKNRDTDMPFESAVAKAKDFFLEIASFAENHNTVIAVEANPVTYHTRFINRTEQAATLVKKINNANLKVNVDLGTIIQNNEDITYLHEIPDYINHVHISEPNLAAIKRRTLHNELFRLLRQINYKKYVSIEMKNCADIATVKDRVLYVKECAKEIGLEDNDEKIN